MAISCPENNTVCDTIEPRNSVHNWSNLFMQNPEYRLIACESQDRSVNTFSFEDANARTTNKGFLLHLQGRRYSLTSCNNPK